MREIKTEIEIKAPAGIILNILTNFQRFPEWNPFMQRASGEIKEGSRLKISIQPPNSNKMNFKPKVIRVRKERELRWLGRLLIPGIFDGEHIFEIEAIDKETSRFVQREKFKGILVPFLWNSLNKNTRQGFENMNEALKQEAKKAGL